MKQKTMILGAAAVALVLYFRPRTIYTPKTGVAPAYQVPGMVYDAQGFQHDTVQAATPTNTDYLANWQGLSNAWGNDPNLWL